MTSEKTPYLLVVIVRTKFFQWFVAGIDLRGEVSPLVRSDEGNLDSYLGQSEDEQLSFLRHRLSGAMQRGCDRLWAKHAKAVCIVLIADDHLLDCETNRLPLLAEHLYIWMTRPPVSCYRADGDLNLRDFSSFHCLVGEPHPEQIQALTIAMPTLASLLDDSNGWELIPKPSA